MNEVVVGDDTIDSFLYSPPSSEEEALDVLLVVTMFLEVEVPISTMLRLSFSLSWILSLVDRLLCMEETNRRDENRRW